MVGPTRCRLVFLLVSVRVHGGPVMVGRMVGPFFLVPILCPVGGPTVVLTLGDRRRVVPVFSCCRDQSTQPGRYGTIRAMRLSLADWARQRGVPYRTANRWFHQGLLPEGVQPRTLPSGALEVEVDPLAGIDIPAIAAALEDAGYRFATRPDE